MNFAKVENSKRLQKVIRAFRQQTWSSTIELGMAAQVTSPGTAIAEINRNEGYVVEKRTRKDGAAEYRLVRTPKGKGGCDDKTS